LLAGEGTTRLPTTLRRTYRHGYNSPEPYVQGEPGTCTHMTANNNGTSLVGPALLTTPGAPPASTLSPRMCAAVAPQHGTWSTATCAPHRPRLSWPRRQCSHPHLPCPLLFTTQHEVHTRKETAQDGNSLSHCTCLCSSCLGLMPHPAWTVLVRPEVAANLSWT